MRSAHTTGRSESPPFRSGGFFRSLPAGALREFQAVVSLIYYPSNAVLFEEEQEASRILILVEGAAKLSVNSSDGKRLILWIARPLQLLGLTSVLSGNTYEVTAETIHPCTIASIRRKEFLEILLKHPGAYKGVTRELSLEMSRACEQMRVMGLSSSASVKLARLLLEWSSDGRPTARGTSVSVLLNHEEMGECIGVTRETVSRAMAELRRRRLIEMHGSALLVRNRFALKVFAEGLHRALSAPSMADRPGCPRLSGNYPREMTEITSGRQG